MDLLNSGVRWKGEKSRTEIYWLFPPVYLKIFWSLGKLFWGHGFRVVLFPLLVPRYFGRKYKRREHSLLLFFSAVLLCLPILFLKHRGSAPFLRNLFLSLFSRSNNFYQPIFKVTVGFLYHLRSSVKAIGWQLFKILYVYLRYWIFHLQDFYLFFFTVFFFYEDISFLNLLWT